MKSIYTNDKERAFNRYLMHHGMEKVRVSWKEDLKNS